MKKELQFTEYTSRPQVQHVRMVGSKPKKHHSAEDWGVVIGLCALAVGVAFTLIMAFAFLS